MKYLVALEKIHFILDENKHTIRYAKVCQDLSQDSGIENLSSVFKAVAGETIQACMDKMKMQVRIWLREKYPAVDTRDFTITCGFSTFDENGFVRIPPTGLTGETNYAKLD
jgi:hypothetical protein